MVSRRGFLESMVTGVGITVFLSNRPSNAQQNQFPVVLPNTSNHNSPQNLSQSLVQELIYSFAFDDCKSYCNEISYGVKFHTLTGPITSYEALYDIQRKRLVLTVTEEYSLYGSTRGGHEPDLENTMYDKLEFEDNNLDGVVDLYIENGFLFKVEELPALRRVLQQKYEEGIKVLLKRLGKI